MYDGDEHVYNGQRTEEERVTVTDVYTCSSYVGLMKRHLAHCRRLQGVEGERVGRWNERLRGEA
jgi:hypothetical protein